MSGDAIELANRVAQLLPRLAAALARASMRQYRSVSGLDYSLIDYQGIAAAAFQFGIEWWLNPQRAWAAQAELWERYTEILSGRAATAPPAKAAPHVDKRFQNPAWSEDPALRLVRDLYVAHAEWMLAQVCSASSLAHHDVHKLEFYTRQLLSALSPSNWPAINPQVRARAVETGGESLVAGLERLVCDLESGIGLVPITQNDPKAFEVGRNLATTPGEVVFRNRLIELIQFAPSTSRVFRHPLLFVPPWINKYYILDLQPENSLLRWLVGQGHTVFVISWANPEASHADLGMVDYMREGPLAALKVVQEITGEDEINLGGFCIGGILTLCTLAYLSGRGRAPVKSATLLATMVDLSDIGDTAVFIDESQLASIERHTRSVGYLDGSHMKDMFSLLRENDLVWNYVVAGYLQGLAPPAFDILHWNADSTRLPARMLTDFLRNIYMENGLVRRGRLRLDGEPIDLGRISSSCYFLSTVDDHIAPWRASYPATQVIGAPVEFVLAGSGHIAGIVNPPSKRKYGYRTSPRHPPSADQWLAGAEQHAGSWWPHWASWLAARSGDQVAPRAVGSNAFPPLGKAPGTFVHVR